MEMRQIRYFVTLAETASASKASVMLSVAQPAISRQIRLLEEELGVSLFHRTGRGMELTEAGRMLSTRAKTILSDLQTLEHDVRSMRGVAEGEVVFGVPPTESHILVPPLIRRLRERHKGVTLKIVEAFSGYVNEWLLTGRLDVALFYKVARTKHLVADELLRESLFLVGAKGVVTGDGPVAIAELADRNFILPSRSHGLRVLIDQVAESLKVKIDVDLEVDALMTIKSLVEAGIGLTILPFPAVQREVENGLLSARQIRPDQLERTLVLATSTQHPLSLASRIVARESVEVVRELVAKKMWVGAL